MKTKKRISNPRYKPAHHLLIAVWLAASNKKILDSIWQSGTLQRYYGGLYTKEQAQDVFRELWVKQARKMPKAVIER